MMFAKEEGVKSTPSDMDKIYSDKETISNTGPAPAHICLIVSGVF